MDVLNNVKNVFKSKEINLDNWSFKLFYRVTYGLLILASMLVFATQYVGDPIECAYDGEVTNKVFEKKCWIHGAEKLAGPGTNEPDREYQKRYDCLIKVSLFVCNKSDLTESRQTPSKWELRQSPSGKDDGNNILYHKRAHVFRQR